MKQNVFRKPSGIVVSLLVWCFLLLPVAPVLSAAPASATLSSECLSSGWPHDQSDLQPDPSLVFGRLDNGLRYVFMTNHKPKDRVALYLNVQAGSMHETEEQRGVAHFLEHMLFNGTTHYPPGTLVEYFQSIGMGFGGDTNAHTGFDETVYNLLLPSGSPKVLEEGLRVLADYARGALLLPEEVDRERGIILAEKRTRDSAASRVSKEQMQFDFAGTLVAQRDPIGTEKVLHSADSRLLRSFYDRWYRPENMMVIAVGDMNLKEAEKILKQYFSTLKGVGQIGACPPFGTVAESGTAVLFHPEPELGYANVALTTVFNTQPRPDTLAWEKEQLRQYVAVSMLSDRLDTLEQKPDSPLAQPRAMAGIFVQRIGYATLATRTEPGKWQQGLTLLQTTLAQALQNGFSEGELRRAKREIAAYLEKAVQTASSRDSGEIAGQIIRKLNSNEVILSPTQEMTLYHPVLEKMTLDEVNSALRQLWSGSRRLVAVAGAVDSSLTKGREKEQISKVFHANEVKPITPWVEEQRVAFPYLPAPATIGTIVDQVQHKDIGVESYVVQGGVRVNVKSTDFQANQVLLSVQFGKGRQSEPVDGLGMMAEGVVRESGVGQLTREQLETALTGTNVSLDFRVGPESFSLNGTSLSRELELLLQLVYCRLHDPAFRPEAFRRSRDNLHRMYEQLGNTVEGIQQMQGERFLAGSSREYGLPSWEQVAQIQLRQIGVWLKPEFSREPLEINIVGDIQPKEVLRLVTKYFGSEQRTGEEDTQGGAIVFPAGEQRFLPVNSSIDKALLTVSWQTGDYWDINRTRRLNLLAAVLDDRLRIKIREELGAAYSPQVFSQPSRVHAGFGLLTSRLTVAPDRAVSLAEVIKKVAADLGAKGVSEDELRRALQPTLTSIKDIKRDNRYWLEAVLNLSSRHPQQLQWPLTITEGFAAITADELTMLAKRYLQEKQAAMVVVAPADTSNNEVPAASSPKVPAARP
jgi:zinc protease